MENVLAGVRVLEVAQWWFVPSAGAVLADWGAEVIKVEHPETGDPQRGLVTSGLVPKGGFNFMWEQPNRGKKSVGIDLRADSGRGLLYRLAARSDVFLTSFLPEARRRLRIDVPDIRAVSPKIIYARGSGQGVRGPEAERGGYDGASFWARGGIAAALFRRERTGEPAVVDISLLATAMWTLAPDITMARALAALSGRMPRFDRRMSPNPIVNAYPTKDGRWIMLIMLQSDRNWPDLCRHLGRPDLCDDPRFADSAKRFENRGECVDTLDAIFSQRTLEEWKQVLATTDGVWAPVQRPIELYDDPQVLANGYLPEVELGDGSRCQLVASPVHFDEAPSRLRHAPECGQDTEQVLLELGLDWEAIGDYKKSGAIL